MHSRFEQYLDELEKPLQSLPVAERQAMREEAGQHLDALLIAHEELGTSREEAVEAALRQFGDARRVGKGVRREAVRRRLKTRVGRGAELLMAMYAGAFGALLLAVLFNAPLVIAGSDAWGIYVALGVAFGLAACLRQKARRFRWQLGGVLAGLILASFTAEVYRALNHAISESGGVLLSSAEPWNSLRQVLVSRIAGWGAGASLSNLLPTTVVGAFVWAYRMSLRRAIPLSVLIFVAIAPVMEIHALVARDYIIGPALRQYFTGQIAEWAKHGVVLGMLFVGLRTLVENAAGVVGPRWGRLRRLPSHLLAHVR